MIEASDRADRVRALWCEILRVHSAEDDDDFFDHGGHSLILMRLISRVEFEFDLELSLAKFLAEPTIANLIQLAAPEPG